MTTSIGASTATGSAEGTSGTKTESTTTASTKSAAPAEPVSANASEDDATVEDGTTDEKSSEATEKADKKKDWGGEISAYVYAMFMLQQGENEPDDVPDNQFLVRNAKIQFKWNQYKLLQAVIEADFADKANEARDFAPLRDVYIKFQPLKEAQLRLGQFKKPFGRVANLSRRELPLVERGLTDDWIIDRLGFGDRDAGAQVEGTVGMLPPNVSYAVGIFNGTGRNKPEDEPSGSKDVACHVQSQLTEWASIGAGVSYKRFDRARHTEAPASATMFGGDFEVATGGLRVVGEGMYGNNPLSIDEYKSLSALLFATYKFRVWEKHKLSLEPLLKGELLQAEDKVKDSYILSGLVGANLHLGKKVRLMVQGEYVKPSENTLTRWTEDKRLFVQAGIHTD